MLRTKIDKFLTYSLPVIVIIIFIVFSIKITNGILPLWSDEFFYFTNSHNFSENLTLRSSFTYTGEGSILFHADAHGIGYPLLNGIVEIIFGFNYLNIPLTNIFIVVTTFLIIFRSRLVNNYAKSLAVFLVLGNFSVIFYAFSFMQESLQLLISVLAAFLLIDIYRERDWRKIFFFLLLLLVAGVFRGLWLFLVVGLLPLARNKKELYYGLSLCAGSIVISFLYMKYLHESVPGFFSEILDKLRNDEFSSAANMVFDHIFTNLKIFFVDERNWPFPYYQYKMLIFVSAFYVFITTLFKRQLIYVATSFIVFINFFLLFAFYDVCAGREFRTMSPILYFIVIIFIANNEKIAINILLMFVVLTFPFTVKFENEVLTKRIQHASRAPKGAQFSPLYLAIAQTADVVHDPLILLSYIPGDNSYDFLYFPVKTKSGKQIRYAINSYQQNLDLSSFDFVLTKDGIELPYFLKNKQPVFSSAGISLFRML